MKLYSYCLRYDGGSAPNPFWGVCTLVICKPAIRRTAQIGDWIVGLGSVNSPIGDISTSVVYAMKVTNKLTIQAYDQFCKTTLPKKIPNRASSDFRLQSGDCIYDYGTGDDPKIRSAVHNECHRIRDLSGGFALLSNNFYYFGDQPIPLPEHLYPIIHTTQGHKSIQNQPYAQNFVKWIESLGYRKNKLYGIPQFFRKSLDDEGPKRTCVVRKTKTQIIRQVKNTC
jgi:hypothetical protein